MIRFPATGAVIDARVIAMESLCPAQGNLRNCYELMHKMHTALKVVLPHPLLLHGSMTRKELLESFRSTKNTALPHTEE